MILSQVHLLVEELFRSLTVLLEVATIMIPNGLYLATTRMLDGVDAHNRHIMVLRDGTIRGGGPFFYTVGGCHPWRTSPLLCPSLSFRCTQCYISKNFLR
jgi:hypothetical protein